MNLVQATFISNFCTNFNFATNIADQLICNQSLSEFPPAILMGLIPFLNVNHADLAPAYTGLLFGITNMMANIPGFLAPEMVGAFTVEGTWSEKLS